MAKMNINRGTADNTTGGTKLELKKPVNGIYVRNRSATVVLKVRVPQVTGSEFDYVEPGDTGEYINPSGSIDGFCVETDAGTADYSQGILIGGMPEGS